MIGRPDWPHGLSGLARAYTRTRETGSAHTPARRTRRRSHSYARPLELHSFIKVARTDARASRRTAPRLALAPGRPFTSGAYAASRRCITYTHAVSVPVRDCVLMAAIAIDVRSKFKRTYFPNRGDSAAGAVLLLLYLERASERPSDRASDRRQNPRESNCGEREKEKRENACFVYCSTSNIQY